MDPRDIIPNKQIFHVGDLIQANVVFICGFLDPGIVDWAVYLSKDQQIWNQVCKQSHSFGCATSLPACGNDGIPVTSDMIGILYIGVANCVFPCATVIDSSVDPNAIIASHPVTVKAPYQTGYGGLTIVSEPAGASIMIDGTPVGLSPLEDFSIIMGTHDISLTLSGYAQITDTVTIQDQQQVVKSYNFNSGNWWDPIVANAPLIAEITAGIVAATVVGYVIYKAHAKKLENAGKKS